ncbi:hypothetical protein [Psychroflexus planctonicus]|uniref:Uncharacterized protein n=1 Tax=Psychroflexus planctonicus TaxID=1526575 RepID=A0ABQ1SE74_9FLAO|nr:hypothetical protein [Psychroflexus planctonicus]GGE31693.1 hypothetical protein GCM10010832_10020 [Psychroflexus planctonicus]
MNQIYNLCPTKTNKKTNMETKEMKTTVHQTKEINLVDGKFTKSQALDILTALIDQKINYHKIEGLQLWESNHNIDKKPINSRVEELKNEREELKTFIRSLKNKDVKLNINGVLHIDVID